jgi:PAS domain S-box-containing protein
MSTPADYSGLSREQLIEQLRAQEQIHVSYRLLMEQAPDGIFIADAEGNYVGVNQAGAAMLGYTREEVLTMNIADIIIPEEVHRIPEEVARYIDGAIVVAEWQFRRKDGSVFLGEVVGRRLPDGRLQGILRDITERWQREIALRESESFYRQTLESIPGMVFTTRPDGYCDYQSQQWVDYTGIPMSEHLGDGWNHLLHPDDRPLAFVAWRDAVEGRAPYDLEYRVRRHDGGYEWFRVIGRPIREASGRIVRWFGVAMNIDVLKQTGAERLAVLERQRDTLVREVHHRIKNHLQGVSGLLRGLVQEYPESAAPLGEAIERVRAIAQVYGLQSSRPDARVRLCDLLRTAAEGAVGPVPVSCRLPAAGMEAILAPEETVPLALVVNELITNAIKHLDPVDPLRPVRVSLDILQDAARAEVRSGPARLPPDFDFAQRRGLRTGLDLLRSLLPPKGATLRYWQEGDEVVAELVLVPPVVTLVIA